MGILWGSSSGISKPLPVPPKTTNVADLQKFLNELAQYSVEVEGVLRQQIYENSDYDVSYKTSHDGKEALRHAILRGKTPWSDIPVPETAIPGMISEEERQYYCYIGRFYSGIGEVVELGPWLGCSTGYIFHGLEDNHNFAGKQLHVFDDFVWRSSWMDQYYTGADRPNNHESFQHLFDNYLEPYRNMMKVRRSKIVDHDGNEEVPLLSWDDGPIELCYVDCGKNFDVNEAWWHLLAKHFIPYQTLIIMQDWGTCREVPLKWWNQTKLFTESHQRSLELVHELAGGCIATFQFKEL